MFIIYMNYCQFLLLYTKKSNNKQHVCSSHDKHTHTQFYLENFEIFLNYKYPKVFLNLKYFISLVQP